MSDYARRVHVVYLYAVCFASLLLIVLAGAMAVYGLFRIAAPSTTVSSELSGISEAFSSFNEGADNEIAAGMAKDERRQGTADLIRWGLVAGGAIVLFRLHWQQAERARGEAPALALPPAETVITPVGDDGELPPVDPSPFAPEEPTIVFEPESAKPAARRAPAKKTAARRPRAR